MTPDDDADLAGLAALGQALPALDLDARAADRIARRARPDLGRGPSPWRLVEPVLAALITGGYAVWGVLKILEALG